MSVSWELLLVAKLKVINGQMRFRLKSIEDKRSFPVMIFIAAANGSWGKFMKTPSPEPRAESSCVLVQDWEIDVWTDGERSDPPIKIALTPAPGTRSELDLSQLYLWRVSQQQYTGWQSEMVTRAGATSNLHLAVFLLLSVTRVDGWRP